MCGIVGLLIKSEPMRCQLGQLTAPMFTCMAARGPDSGGCAVYGETLEPPFRRFSLCVADRSYDWQALIDSFRQSVPNVSEEEVRYESIENHAVLISACDPAVVRSWLERRNPQVCLLSIGRSVELYKDAGPPDEIVSRFRIAEASGSHCVGHTRMATESAVTLVHSHPYSAGEDFCLVHNGSLSNPYMLRRKLEREGLRFETDNDTEAACRFIEWRLRQGDNLQDALAMALKELDGFFTLLMTTREEICIVRDAFACKPAVVAETDDYVAICSEFRALAHLPGINDAEIFEPKPEEIYSWQV